MAFDKLPRSFFGPAFGLASNAISFPTADETTGTVTGGTFTADATSNVITTTSAHNLKVGDRVKLTAGTVLPAPLAAATVYWVVAVPTALTLQLAASKGGPPIDITSVGTGTAHTILALGMLDEVTNAEADPAGTGDWRKVISGFMFMLFQRWNGIAPADRPAKVTITRASSINPTTLQVTLTYTVRIVSTTAGVEVADE